jgi:hypothetical protein
VAISTDGNFDLTLDVFDADNRWLGGTQWRFTGMPPRELYTLQRAVPNDLWRFGTYTDRAFNVPASILIDALA